MEFFRSNGDSPPAGAFDLPPWALDTLVVLIEFIKSPVGRMALLTDPEGITTLKTAFMLGAYAERQGWDTDIRAVETERGIP